jgi:hypothetical protein
MRIITQLIIAVLISGLALVSMSSLVYAEDTTANNIKYLNGGIGQEESDMMKTKAGDFNLRLYMSEGKHGHFITDTKVTIKDKKGNVVLDLASGGPMLFIEVENGHYTIQADYLGNKIIRKVVVTNHRGVNVYLTWKGDQTETDTNEESSDENTSQ